MWTSKIKKVNCIKTNMDGIIYLSLKGRNQRRETPLTKEQEAKSIAYLERTYTNIWKDGIIHVDDDDFGGCNGDPHNGWEEGRWTSWTAAECARMLTEAGIWWEEDEPHEVITIGF